MSLYGYYKYLYMENDGFTLVGIKKTLKKPKLGQQKKTSKDNENQKNTPIVSQVQLNTTPKVQTIVPPAQLNVVSKPQSKQHNKYIDSKNDDNQESKHDDVVKKRILCNNMFSFGKCPYGTGCVYAHSLEEQRIDPLRNKIYKLIKNQNIKLDDIDFVHDKELYRAFLQLTRMCFGCENGTCLGGYNCKNGSFKREYVICINDLNFGKCQNINCDKIHLTKRGLIPNKLQCMIYNGNHTNKQEYVDTLEIIIPPPIELNNETFPKLYHDENCEKNNDEIESLCSLSSDSSSCSGDEYIFVLNKK